MGDVDETRNWEFGLDGPMRPAGPSAAYQIGDGHLFLLTPDEPFANQFRRLYGDCLVDVSSVEGPRVECEVDLRQAVASVTVRALDGAADLATFLETAFGDRGCRRLHTDDDGWHHMQCDLPTLTFRVRDDSAAFALGSPWRHLAANLAVGFVIRQQRNVIFMHASGVGLRSGQGIVFVGPKGAGKTTMAIGLAARGHQFFGDELVGVRAATWEVVPVRRTIAKREGPCDSALTSALETVPIERRRYADGHWRRMITPGQAFGTIPTPKRLGAVVFLEGFGETPELTRVTPSLEAASRLTPVASTLWNQSPTARVFALLKLLAAVPSYSLRLGPPDDTSQLIEKMFTS